MTLNSTISTTDNITRSLHYLLSRSETQGDSVIILTQYPNYKCYICFAPIKEVKRRTIRNLTCHKKCLFSLKSEESNTHTFFYYVNMNRVV